MEVDIKKSVISDPLSEISPLQSQLEDIIKNMGFAHVNDTNLANEVQCDSSVCMTYSVIDTTFL